MKLAGTRCFPKKNKVFFVVFFLYLRNIYVGQKKMVFVKVKNEKCKLSTTSCSKTLPGLDQSFRTGEVSTKINFSL